MLAVEQMLAAAADTEADQRPLQELTPGHLDREASHMALLYRPLPVERGFGEPAREDLRCDQRQLDARLERRSRTDRAAHARLSCASAGTGAGAMNRPIARPSRCSGRYSGFRPLSPMNSSPPQARAAAAD